MNTLFIRTTLELPSGTIMKILIQPVYEEALEIDGDGMLVRCGPAYTSMLKINSFVFKNQGTVELNRYGIYFNQTNRLVGETKYRNIDLEYKKWLSDLKNKATYVSLDDLEVMLFTPYI